jgi:acyl carrier protein
MSTTEREILGVLSVVSGRECDSIFCQQELNADLGIDSAKTVQLLLELESTLHVLISNEDAERFVRVNDVLVYAIEQRRACA